MDHLAIMHKGYIEKILACEKTIESRFSKNKISPYGRIKKGDVVYMQEVGKEVTAQFIVKRVLFFQQLTKTKIMQIRSQYGKDICATEDYWLAKMDAKYGTLIFIDDPSKITPFKILKKDRLAFKSIENIKNLFLDPRTIIKHPHHCEQNKHYFIFDGSTHCQFCNSKFKYMSFMKTRPSYSKIKEIMKESEWNNEWFLKELDEVSKEKVDFITLHDIKDRLLKSIKICDSNDGKQTPYTGNPIFYAQHALGCCCRKCLEKFYGIPKSTPLSEADLEYFAKLITEYIQEKM